MKMHEIESGRCSAPDLLGQTLGKYSKTTDSIPQSVQKAYCSNEENCCD